MPSLILQSVTSDWGVSPIDITVSIVPEASEKIKFLGEFDKTRKEPVIEDPIGMPLDFYKGSYEGIKRAVEGLIKCLKK